jgi:hypothetical protein
MRLTFIYVLLSLALFSCKKQEREIRYYPSKKLYNQTNLVSIPLDSLKLNFIEITNKVNSIYNKNKIPLIEIKDNSVSKRIVPLMFDEIRKRDVLSITSDSILIDYNYSITELKNILKRYYTNNGKNYRYPRSYKNVVVEVTLDTSKNTKDLIKTLFNLTKVFDEINMELEDSLELRIFFNYFRQIPPPLLPSSNN